MALPPPLAAPPSLLHHPTTCLAYEDFGAILLSVLLKVWLGIVLGIEPQGFEYFVLHPSTQSYLSPH